MPSAVGQLTDPGNSKVITLADAAPGSPWVGAWRATRDFAIIRQLTTIASNVPAGFTGYLTQVVFGASLSSVNIAQGQLFLKRFGEPTRVVDNFVTGTTAAAAVYRYIAPLVLPEKSDLEFRASSSANNTSVNVRADILLVANG